MGNQREFKRTKGKDQLHIYGHRRRGGARLTLGRVPGFLRDSKEDFGAIELSPADVDALVKCLRNWRRTCRE